MQKPISQKFYPENSGVYLFSKGDLVVYVGKAVNLRRRISSYFASYLEPKTRRMISEADSIRFIKVTSELEALLLEAKLIKKYKPKFNVVLKDDKNPLFISITKDEYPKVITARRDGEFGPFPNSRNVYSVLRMIRKIFPYSDHKIGKRPCLYSQIGLCSPCPNAIERESDKAVKSELKRRYLINIRRVRAVLSGKFLQLKKELVREMEALSKQNKFEEAKEVRDKISRLDYITRPQIPADEFLQNPNLIDDVRQNELTELKKLIKKNGIKLKRLERIECFDISHISGTSTASSMVTFVRGEPDKRLYRHFRIKLKEKSNDYGSLRETAQRRKKNLKNWGRADLLIIDGGLSQVHAFTDVFGDLIPIVGIAKNPDRLVFPNGKKIRLAGSVLNLVARIRDEAHRFARRYHHKLFLKSLHD